MMAKRDEEASRKLTRSGRGLRRARPGSDSSTVRLVQNLLGAQDIGEFLSKRDVARAKRTRAGQAREDVLAQRKLAGQGPGTGAERLGQARATQLQRSPIVETTRAGQRTRSFATRPSIFQESVQAGTTTQDITKRFGRAQARGAEATAGETEASTQFIRRSTPSALPAGGSEVASLPQAPARAANTLTRPGQGKGSSFQNLNVPVTTPGARPDPLAAVEQARKSFGKLQNFKPVLASDISKFRGRRKELTGEKRRKAISQFATR